MAPLIESPRQAVWLVPTPNFRIEQLLNRPQAWATPDLTRDPTRAQAHRIERDTLLVERVREQALARGLRVIDVDSSRPLAEIEAHVVSHLSPYLPV